MWVDVDGAPVEAIERQVRACPSGALSFLRLTPAPPGR